MAIMRRLHGRDFAARIWIALRLRVMHTPTRWHPGHPGGHKWVAWRLQVLHGPPALGTWAAESRTVVLGSFARPADAVASKCGKHQLPYLAGQPFDLPGAFGVGVGAGGFDRFQRVPRCSEAVVGHVGRRDRV